ncbi:rho guanine nucleotide exchange factor 11 isoform X4 [Lingula anatina]|uniref:Rho guanine nucleotide exchange factor 11 isoform X4 n=1 Tax=Lingula anatina TaxID=7574 RepID=A0A2R2MIU7_LINAN|nr:rho guanine nucleotide exchange factor 11 isoform X4 [Lingula anatina]|eukprot:XP_023930146.1 rho guanine nucleotide exchange factor 11 isoform X4 [Lingula anatina]
MSVNDKLGSLSRDSSKEDLKPPQPDKIIDTTDSQGEQLIQRCVIIQRDEKGYGLTVSGDNPVFVQSVKDNGAAARAGVQQGDRIIKVNGTLVTNSNHIEVVKLIKASSYVALTLLGRPPGQTNKPLDPPTPSLRSGSMTEKPGTPERVHVTGPQPVDPSKEREFASQKINTTLKMYEQAMQDYERLKDQYSKNPTEKLLSQIADYERMVRQLENQLKNLGVSPQDSRNAGTQSQGSPPSTIHPDRGDRAEMIKSDSKYDSEDSLENFADDSSYDSHSYPSSKGKNVAPWLGPGGPRHFKSGSMPDSFYQSEERYTRDINIERSKSDADARARQLTSSDTYPLMGKGRMDSAADLRRRVMRKSISLPLSTDEGGGGLSDRDSIESPSTSPTPSHPRNRAWGESMDQSDTNDGDTTSTGEDMKVMTPSSSPPPERGLPINAAFRPQQTNIMCAEDDDFTSDDDHLEERNAFHILSTLETRPHLYQPREQQGPFSDLNVLKNKPAHLAVFLHYLISNSDPSPLFFYLVTDSYQQQTGNAKEMKKWAYEIHSTFLVPNAPLKLNIEENVILAADKVLERGTEEQLRNIFNKPRDVAQNDIRELLADFRRTGDLGLSSIYGAHELKDEYMDRNNELKIAEKYLAPHLERLVDDRQDRAQAMASALTTFLRSVGITKVGQTSNVLERCPSFVAKDKRFTSFMGLKKNVKKVFSVRGHSFMPQHYSQTTFCVYCHNIIWGIGYQGYQCKDCKCDIHKQCLDVLEEPCVGKRKRPSTAVYMREQISSLLGPGSGAEKKTPSSLVPPKTPGPEDETVSPSAASSRTAFYIQAGKKEEEPDLAAAQDNKYVKRVIQKFESPPEPEANSSATTAAFTKADGEPEKTTEVKRSESLRGRPFSSAIKRRQTKSDVDKDEDALKTALAGTVDSSSSSSLSQRSDDLTVEPTSGEHDSDFDVETSMPPLEKLVPREMYKKLKPKERKRQEVMNELFYTERAHVRNLKVMERVFRVPMINAGFADLANLLFVNLPRVIELHCELNNKMRAIAKEHPLVKAVGDILLSRFEGEAGKEFQEEVATFCQKQSYALDTFKNRRRKDQKLASFLIEAEAHPQCRRLELQSLIPQQMQRLTKYPLLIENLMKHTSVNDEDQEKLQKALKLSKDILTHVNKTMADFENHQKLLDLAKRIDRKAMDNYAVLQEYKNIDLTNYTLIYDGSLTWRVNRTKSIDLHAVLLNDILMLLQKQDEKLVLKCHSMVVGKEDTKFTHSPIIKLTNLLTRNVATDKKAFFLVSTSAVGPQIYELAAMTAEEKKKWFKHITEAAEAHKSREKENPLQRRRHARVATNDSGRIQEEKEEKPGDESSLNRAKSQSVESLDNLDRNEVVQVTDQPQLVQPAEVVVTEKVMQRADSVMLTPHESLKKKDQQIRQALQDKQRITAEILQIEPAEFENVAELACALEGEKEAKELILGSILQTNRLTALVSDALRVDKDTPPEQATVRVENKQLYLSLPADKLNAITRSLSEALTQLLTVMSKSDKEKEDLRLKVKEMDDLRDQIKAINEMMVMMNLGGGSSGSRPQSFISEASTASEVEEQPTVVTSSEDSVGLASSPTKMSIASHPDTQPGKDDSDDDDNNSSDSDNEHKEDDKDDATVVADSEHSETVTESVNTPGGKGAEDSDNEDFHDSEEQAKGSDSSEEEELVDAPSIPDNSDQTVKDS